MRTSVTDILLTGNAAEAVSFLRGFTTCVGVGNTDYALTVYLPKILEATHPSEFAKYLAGIADTCDKLEVLDAAAAVTAIVGALSALFSEIIAELSEFKLN